MCSTVIFLLLLSPTLTRALQQGAIIELNFDDAGGGGGAGANRQRKSAQMSSVAQPLTCPVNSTAYLHTVVSGCTRRSEPLTYRYRTTDDERPIEQIACVDIGVDELEWLFACIAAMPDQPIALEIRRLRDPFVTFESILPSGAIAGSDEYRNLVELSIESVYGLILPSKMLDFFPRLRMMRLRQVDLGKTLPDNAFLQHDAGVGGGHALRDLIIEDCSLEAVADDAFRGIRQLERLTIRQNALVDLPFRALRDMLAMRELDLGENQLSLPPYQEVAPLPSSLVTLNLSSNLFSDFPYRLLKSGSGMLETLDLSRNRITFLKAKQLRASDRE